MWTPSSIHAWLVNVLAPIGGMFLIIYLPVTHQFEQWQILLIAGLLAVPLAAPERDNE